MSDNRPHWLLCAIRLSLLDIGLCTSKVACGSKTPTAECRCARAIASAVLDSLGKPTDDMLLASWNSTTKVTPEEAMAAELCDAKSAHVHKMRRRWKAVIDKLRSEVSP